MAVNNKRPRKRNLLYNIRESSQFGLLNSTTHLTPHKLSNNPVPDYKKYGIAGLTDLMPAEKKL